MVRIMLQFPRRLRSLVIGLLLVQTVINIKKELCYVAIYLAEKDGKTEITAVPFQIIKNGKIAIENIPLFLGIRIIIEGLADALNYDYEIVDMFLDGLE